MRYAAQIEYDGFYFYGWQRQSADKPSIQAALEKAISRVANEPIEIVGAGRTDAKVHAISQMIHFDSQADRSLDNWLRGINANLTPSIRLLWIQPVHSDFHARLSALARTYRYVILNRPVASAIDHKKVTHWSLPLDVTKMHKASQFLLGEHDFSAFRSSQCQSRTPMRYVHAIDVTRHNHWVIIDIRANAFLHHMVRNIVGTLLQLDLNAQSIDALYKILLTQDRSKAGMKAPADGLYLLSITYPSHYGLPAQLNRTFF